MALKNYKNLFKSLLILLIAAFFSYLTFILCGYIIHKIMNISDAHVDMMSRFLPLLYGVIAVLALCFRKKYKNL